MSTNCRRCLGHGTIDVFQDFEALGRNEVLFTEPCTDCAGTGKLLMRTRCSDTGTITVDDGAFKAAGVVTCTLCKGLCKVGRKHCEWCRGYGVVSHGDDMCVDCNGTGYASK